MVAYDGRRVLAGALRQGIVTGRNGNEIRARLRQSDYLLDGAWRFYDAGAFYYDLWL